MLPCLAFGQAFNCTVNDGVCFAGVFSDPESCAHFYRCVQDAVDGCLQTREQCPEFFAFDKDAHRCLLATQTNCDGN